MKQKRFTEEQIIKALKEVDDGAEAWDVCRRLGVTEQSFYRWRRKYAGMDVSEAKRLRETPYPQASSGLSRDPDGVLSHFTRLTASCMP